MSISKIFIENNQLTKEILSNLFNKQMTTRNSIGRVSSSCKFTQLRYIILVVYEKSKRVEIGPIYLNRYNDSGPYGDLLRNVGYVIDYIYLYSRVNPFYNIIVNNIIDPVCISQDLNDLKPIIPIKNDGEFMAYLSLYSVNKSNEYRNICFCFIDSFNSEYYIFHYFTIIIHNDLYIRKQRYYISSSYGTGDICIPQNTIEIPNLNELKLFFQVFNDVQANEGVFKSLFAKYFATKGIMQYYIDEDSRGPGVSIAPKEGLERELSFFPRNCKVAIIHKYEETIQQLFNDLFGTQQSSLGGKSRKTRHRKKKNTRKRVRRFESRSQKSRFESRSQKVASKVAPKKSLFKSKKKELKKKLI
jgi:gas vesicle protein